MTAYEKLERRFRRLSRLGHLESMASWDEAVMMPEGGGAARAEALAEVKTLMVELLADPQIGDWLEDAQQAQEKLSSWQKANLREMKRVWVHATSVTPQLVEATALASRRCEQAWRQFRKANDWKAFLPIFKEVVRLVQEEAQQRSAATGLTPYNAMMDLYEPGLRSEHVDGVFSELMNFLPGFIEQVVERQKQQPLVKAEGPFGIDRQTQLGLETMKTLGFNFQNGRLDVSHHPFCGGVPQDVRLTTRYTQDDYIESLMGTIHETGHAMYEQGLPAEWLSQPVGQARSMGIHESQSLLFEMQVGRSSAFLKHMAAIMQTQLSTSATPSAHWSPLNLYVLFTRVEPGLIRVNADEVTYPAHVILRYELEQDLLSGALPVADLPEAWNEKMTNYIGLSTLGNDKDGCMQDVHWPSGAFGYFPTYTLGAMNAAQLFASACRECPQIPSQIEQGDLSPLRAWLAEKVWSKASFYEVNDLMKQATGETLNPKYFVDHLRARYFDHK